MRKDIDAYYSTLGLNPGAGPTEIQRAYRQLMRTWHPDLFRPGSPMQATAEDITKEINNAFEQLYRKKLYRKFRSRGEPGAGSDPQKPGESASAERPPEAEEPPPTPGPRVRRWPGWRRFGGLRRISWKRIAFVAALGASALPAWNWLRERSIEVPVRTLSHPQPNAPERPAAPARAAAPRGAIPPRHEPLRAGTRPERAAIRPGPGIAFLDIVDPAETPAPALAVDFAGQPPRSAGATARRAGLLDVFEVGDSKSTVLAVQGNPDEAGDGIFRYGSSLVYFENGRVSGWSDRLPRLRVRSWPVIEFRLFDTFSLGSTMGDVLRAQGIPTRFSALSYDYGSSTVYFEHDRVSGWSVGDVPLRSFNVPTLPFIDLDLLRSSFLPP
ncbi:MAG: J domain-containing protein [Opitutaceae bacterium]|jgi:hypothetical protein